MPKPQLRALRQTALTAATLTGLSTAVFADQVFNDDVIVDGGLCVGTSCVNGESFSDTTLKLRSDDNRITSDDTSAGGSVPDTDWQLIFNETGSGAQELFAVKDMTTNRIPFTVRGAAPNNALYIDADGDIGIGTSLPQQELHIVDGNAPTLRLEQDGSIGFASQVWELAGTEGGLLFRDQTNGGALPLRLSTGAPTNSVFVASDGDVGIGTADPTAPLHVRRTALTSADIFRLENNGPTVMRLIDTSTNVTWTFQNQGGTFRVATPLVPGPEMRLEEDGDMFISGELTTAGSCSVGCDRVFDEDYELKPLAEHNALMWEQKHLPNVGPTPEDGPMNLSQKVGGMLNELEHAHIYIGQLHERDAALTAEVAALRRIVADLQNEMAGLREK